jgi:hypothetical protein
VKVEAVSNFLSSVASQESECHEIKIFLWIIKIKNTELKEKLLHQRFHRNEKFAVGKIKL